MGSGWLPRAGLAVVLVAGIGLANARLPDAPRDPATEAFVPEPRFARLASLGFLALASDYYWLRAVQIVGGAEGARGRSREIGELVDVTTTLDPWVSHPYRFAAIWMQDDEAAVREANRLLRRGIEYHPDDWRQYFYLAFNHFYFLDEYDKAADALEPAVGLPGAPRYLGRLLPRLRSRTGGLAVAAAMLRSMADQAPDGYARAQYLRALDEVETERRARILDQARVVFRKRFGRDITKVEDLVDVGPAVLRRLPPEPHGWEWVIDDRGRIVSSYLGYRYEVKVDGRNRALLQHFHRHSEEEEQQREGARRG